MTLIFLILNKSLQKVTLIHKDEISKIRQQYSVIDNFQKSVEGKLISQESKIKKLESEMSRKEFVDDKKQKHSQRIFKINEDLKHWVEDLLENLNSSFENIVSNKDIANKIRNINKIIQGSDLSAATAIEESG